MADPGPDEPLGAPAAPDTATSVLERTETHEELEPGDRERFAHYVRKEKILESALSGKPVIALCGKVWVPGRDPSKFPICPVCRKIREGMSGGDGDDGGRDSSDGGGRRWGFGRGAGK
ncbi:MAG: DUF3039 domain-containing protein [Micrococcales bacterium]|nr:DUF3039 domain-containing protein [Micrococcales bacterium]